jgi:UDPglucose--hexose-1-phosphate uridylyltransferase
MNSSRLQHPSNPNSELRKHYFLEQYVVVAPKRSMRPDAFAHTGNHKTNDTNCHFCHNSEPALWQLPRGRDWRVKVIANAFPALSVSNPQAYGAQEVVIETPEHAVEFSELPVIAIEQVVEAWRRRLQYLKQLPHIRYVLAFKNDGPLAGASVSHAHSQIIALPLIPPKIEQESVALDQYWDKHGTCAYCDIRRWELDHRVRVVGSDKYFTAITPYASEFAYECWIMPNRHIATLEDLNHSEIKSLAVVMKKIAATLDSAGISFNMTLQESIPNQEHHLLIKVAPRTTIWAGAELGSGVIINPVTPEFAKLWYSGAVN